MVTYITLVLIIVAVVSIWILSRILRQIFGFILESTRKDRELNNKRDSYHKEVLEKIKLTLIVVNETQKALDEKMDALSRFIDERNTYVTYQQEHFDAFAKSDMLSARRDELVQVNNLKVALERIMSMTTMSRQSPAAIDVLALESVTSRIKELENILESNKLGGE